MNALRRLCEAFQASPDAKVKLECGCMARPALLMPCVWHRKEFEEALRAVTEDAVECTDSCCDPG